jgi:hypothetical protein
MIDPLVRTVVFPKTSVDSCAKQEPQEESSQ